MEVARLDNGAPRTPSSGRIIDFVCPELRSSGRIIDFVETGEYQRFSVLELFIQRCCNGSAVSMTQAGRTLGDPAAYFLAAHAAPGMASTYSSASVAGSVRVTSIFSTHAPGAGWSSGKAAGPRHGGGETARPEFEPRARGFRRRRRRERRPLTARRASEAWAGARRGRGSLGNVVVVCAVATLRAVGVYESVCTCQL